MAKPVRIGVIGCGSVVVKYMKLAEQLHFRGMADVVLACDVDTSKKQFMRDEFGVEHFTTRYQEVIERDDVDLVLVLTSMLEHGPITKAALQAGKHVLVEKPLAATLEEAAELIEIAENAPGILMPAPHIILSKTYQTIWRRVHRGEIGDVKLARALYGWAGPWWGQWFYRPGGGALFDMGVYNVTSLTGFLGPVKRVMAMTGVAIPERVVEGELMKVQAEDNAHVLLDFGESVFAVVTTGYTIQKYRCPAIELYGTRGTIQMMGDDWDPEGYELWLNSVGAWQVHGEPEPAWPWVDGLRHLVKCIQTGTRPLITPAHGYHVLEIMLKAQESGRDGQAKLIQSTFAPPAFPDEPIGAGPSDAAHLVHDPTDGL